METIITYMYITHWCRECYKTGAVKYTYTLKLWCMLAGILYGVGRCLKQDTANLEYPESVAERGQQNSKTYVHNDSKLGKGCRILSPRWKCDICFLQFYYINFLFCCLYIWKTCWGFQFQGRDGFCEVQLLCRQSAVDGENEIKKLKTIEARA